LVPDKSHACWRSLAMGTKTIKTDALGLQMLLKRVHGKITPSSPAGDIRIAAEELQAFFAKYEKILGNEIKSL
jgi:hypothetical protein